MNKMGTGWPKREPAMIKQSRAKINAALAAHDRIQAESDEIRERHGLPPVPENETVLAWRAKVGAAPAKVLSPAAQAAELAKRRRKLKRDSEELDREIAALAVSGELPAARLARALGVTRQRIHQVARAATA
jgi:hypothetical protein